MGSFPYSPQAGHLSRSFDAWWGDSLTHPRLDIYSSRSELGGEILLLAPGWIDRRSARGGEILLRTLGWTSIVVNRYVVGRFSYSPHAEHLSSSFGAWWGDSLTRPRLDISRCQSARGGEILLLTPGCTSLVVIWRVVGRFSYLPQAGHLFIVIRRVVGRFSYSPQAVHLS